MLSICLKTANLERKKYLGNYWNIAKQTATQMRNIWIFSLFQLLLLSLSTKILWLTTIEKLCIIYIYGIHHWRIIWSSYRDLAWVGFEPTTTEFRSDVLTGSEIRQWAQLALRANLVQLLQFHRLLHLVIPFLSLACYQTINIPFCQKLREMWTDFRCIIHGPVIPKQCMMALNVGLHCSIKFAKIEQARNITWIQLLWDKNKWLNKCSFKDSVFKNDN